MQRLRSARVAAAPSVDLWLIGALLLPAAGLTVALDLAIRHDLIFGFSDTASHVVIPRRVFDNVEPGLSQLGTHWGPLFHVFQLPFVWIDPLFKSGASAITVSVIASLVACFYLYRLTVLVTGRRGAGFVAVLLMAANPNFLYSGVIPMLPATIMATTAANIYYLMRWSFTGSGANLLGAALALTAATLTHFDTWVLAPVEFALVLLIAQTRWRSSVKTEATAILWLLAGGYGLFLFTLMNVMIFGDPFAFTKGFLGTGDALAAGRHGLHALADYPRAAFLMLGPTTTLLGGLGCAGFVFFARREPRYLIGLLLLYPVLWYTLQAATAGSLIVPAENLGHWRNLRYGTTIIPAFAFFIASGFPRRALVVPAVIAVLASSVVMIGGGRVAAWEDAKYDVPDASALARAADWLAERSNGKQALVPVHNAQNDRFELYSGLPSKSFIDASDSSSWRQARRLAQTHPGRTLASGVRWMIWITPRGRSLVRSIARSTGVRLCYSARLPGGKQQKVRIYSFAGTCTSL